MGDRWVCKRCFASNEDAASQCAACGLMRGSEAPASDVWGAAPQAVEAPRRSWLPSLARFWWIPVMILVAAGGSLFAVTRDESGQITDDGDLAVTDLRVGDCFDLKDSEADVVEDVSAKPCGETHEFELYYVGDLPDGDFPATGAVDAFLVDNCLPAFDTYIGLTYQSSVYEIAPFVPTEDGWRDGDHSVQCAVYHPTDAELTGSLRGIGR